MSRLCLSVVFQKNSSSTHVKGAVVCKWKGWCKGVVLMFIFLQKKLLLLMGAGDLVITSKPWTCLESSLMPLAHWIQFIHFWWVSGLKIIVDSKKKYYISKGGKSHLFWTCWSVEISLSHGWSLWTCIHITKWPCNLARQARGILKVIKGIHWLICLGELAQFLAQPVFLCFCLSYTN